jgi:hypothetical protein
MIKGLFHQEGKELLHFCVLTESQNIYSKNNCKEKVYK